MRKDSIGEIDREEGNVQDCVSELQLQVGDRKEEVKVKEKDVVNDKVKDDVAAKEEFKSKETVKSKEDITTKKDVKSKKAVTAKYDVTVKEDVKDSMYLIEELDSEVYTGKWEPEFIELYEQALLNSLWERGLLSREEYEWCQEELKSRSRSED